MNMKSNILGASILIVDDSPINVKLLECILRSNGYTAVSSTTNPREVPELYRANQYDLIILDLNMPFMNGFQVMAALAPLETQGYLPVLVITAEPAYKLRALEAGAKDFLAKPIDHTEVVTRIHNMLEIRLLHKDLRSDNATLEQRVAERTAALRESYRETVVAMSRAVERKDEDTGLHVKRISYYCQRLAEHQGMPGNFCDEIFYGSPMHDIGKIGIPDHILLKPGPHDPDEWRIMQSHTTLGAQVLGHSHSPYLKMGEEIALNHHERWDGTGYPNGLKGEAIPVSARIMNICDIYDALRSKRPYKPAYDHATTLEIITHGDGRTRPDHFDPDIHASFTRLHGEFRDIYESLRESPGGEEIRAGTPE